MARSDWRADAGEEIATLLDSRTPSTTAPEMTDEAQLDTDDTR